MDLLDVPARVVLCEDRACIKLVMKCDLNLLRKAQVLEGGRAERYADRCLGARYALRQATAKLSALFILVLHEH